MTPERHIQFERFTDKDGKPRVHIVAGNGEILLVSEAYESDEARNHVIDVVIENVKSGNYIITTEA